MKYFRFSLQDRIKYSIHTNMLEHAASVAVVFGSLVFAFVVWYVTSSADSVDVTKQGSVLCVAALLLTIYNVYLLYTAYSSMSRNIQKK